jgi:hypothetical protein
MAQSGYVILFTQGELEGWFEVLVDHVAGCSKFTVVPANAGTPA